MPRIMRTKTILGGKQRISGTRISIDLIYNYVRDDAIDRISIDYPHLTKDQVNVAIDYLGKKIDSARGKLGQSSTKV